VAKPKPTIAPGVVRTFETREERCVVRRIPRLPDEDERPRPGDRRDHRQRPRDGRQLARQRHHHAAGRRPSRWRRLRSAEVRDKAAAPGADSATEVAIRWGAFLNAVIAFIVIAFVVWRVSIAFIREPPPAEVKTCPFCKESNAVDASKCRACASEI
jgi:hypothetical protein